MNERTRELTMTAICKSCEHQYGLWRPRCPACGTETPAIKKFNPPRVTAPRTSTSQCAFCRQRGAKQRCSICNELVHNTCLSLHKVECEQYQRDVVLETAKLAGVNS